MARQSYTALTLALLLALFEVGSCLRCYQCNSEQDEACRDPFRAPAGKYLTDCTLPESVSYNQNYLREILTTEIASHVQGAPRYCHKMVLETGAVVRTCLDANPSDINHTCRSLENSSKLPQIQTQFKIKHCSVCDKDSCNGASSIAFSFPLATLALIGTYLFCKQ